ncbi:hypothetical protein L228DRAFT_23434 [Xylona heveae TC161]|uniref:Uncharacterized protein n=1 Tax=Xylona heveae (strain CBS 132557 / TC161) TaxID=1328760 RepID=A0A165AA31_XYLHT|nr:hypothetical protein L228DRAFT_23434 [Xylona heveae TC161]KZF20155.1 hypothetical protein L228DRAFT_23434 [Xylona heveae TC161]
MLCSLSLSLSTTSPTSPLDYCRRLFSTHTRSSTLVARFYTPTHTWDTQPHPHTHTHTHTHSISLYKRERDGGGKPCSGPNVAPSLSTLVHPHYTLTNPPPPRRLLSTSHPQLSKCGSLTNDAIQ